MESVIKELKDVLVDTKLDPSSAWQCKVVVSEQCISYVAWNKDSKEAIIVDPKVEDLESYKTVAKDLKGYRFVAIIDTHTHADHITCGPQLSELLKAPYLMSVGAPSKKVNLRVGTNTTLPTAAGPIHLLVTPGHTADSITPIWGPFLFGGDTLLFGDTGRDDLPTGSAEAHFDSLTLLKQYAKSDMIVLPGHDYKGGRASSWDVQLKVNASLTQKREQFVPEAAAYRAEAPKYLKESLFENFK